MSRTEIHNQIMNHLSHLNLTLERVRQAMDILADPEMGPGVVECQVETIVALIDGAEPKCEEIKTLVQQW